MLNESNQPVGVTTVAFAPNGDFILAGGQNGQIKLWEFDNQPLGGKIIDDGGSQIINLSISPDNKYLLAVDTERRIRLWEIMSANLIQEFQDDNDPYSCATFTHRSDWIAAAKSSGKIDMYSWHTTKVVRELDGEPGGIRSINVSPNGLYLAVGYQLGGASLWELETEKPAKLLRSVRPMLNDNTELSVWINNVSFSHDSKYLVVGGITVAVWDSTTGELVASFTNETHTLGSSLLTPNNQYLVTLAVDNDQHAIRVYNLQTKKLVRHLVGHANFTAALDCSHDGKFILTGSYDGTIRIWGFKSGKDQYTVTF